MQPLYAGSDVLTALERLSMSRRELADMLNMGIKTLSRHIAAPELDACVALAVECLLRRRFSNAPVSPEERAERRHREQVRLRELRLADRSRTPEAIAARQLAIAEAKRRLRDGGESTAVARTRLATRGEVRRLSIAAARNRERDRERPLIAVLHARLAPLAAAQDWPAYHAALQAHALSLGTDPAPNQSAYIDAATTAVLSDDDPLVTLPLESV